MDDVPMDVRQTPVDPIMIELHRVCSVLIVNIASHHTILGYGIGHQPVYRRIRQYHAEIQPNPVPNPVMAKASVDGSCHHADHLREVTKMVAAGPGHPRPGPVEPCEGCEAFDSARTAGAHHHPTPGRLASAIPRGSVRSDTSTSAANSRTARDATRPANESSRPTSLSRHHSSLRWRRRCSLVGAGRGAGDSCPASSGYIASGFHRPQVGSSMSYQRKRPPVGGPFSRSRMRALEAEQHANAELNLGDGVRRHVPTSPDQPQRGNRSDCLALHEAQFRQSALGRMDGNL